MRLYSVQCILFLCLYGPMAGQAMPKHTSEQKKIIDEFSFAPSTGEITNIEGNKYENSLRDVEYTAAALQYQPFSDLSGGGSALLQENALRFDEFAGTAKSMGAQIIVFPEYGLTSLNLGLTPNLLMSQTQVVPTPRDEVVPCLFTDVDDSMKIIQLLSCEAREKEMYFVVDLAEQFNCSNIEYQENSFSTEGLLDWHCKLYNTQVVFDDKGAVVARYRKKHLFVEPQFHKGTEPDVEATFETSFGVTFTLQICFDILYKSPALSNIEDLGVKDVIMSTAWMDQLPFLAAPQIWKGWTEGNKVNLVVANLYDPPGGYLGAGIFRGVTSEPESYTYDTESGTKLIVGKVTTRSVNGAKKSHPVRSTDVAKQPLPATPPSSKNSKMIENPKVCNTTLTEKSTMNFKSMQIRTGSDQKYKHEDLSNYNHIVLPTTPPSTTLNQTLCHNDGLCCSVKYSYPAEASEQGLYMLLAYSGIVTHSHIYNTYVQNCAVVLCFNESTASCAQIESIHLGGSTFSASQLSGTFSDHYVYPAVFGQNLELYDPMTWDFTLTESDARYLGIIDIHPQGDDLLSLTLYSRWYSRDPDEFM